MDHEIALRQEAVRQYLSGESKASISRILGKPRAWVGRWIGRYDPDDPDRSLHNRSSAPKVPHRAWPVAVIQQALNSRRLRMAAAQPGYECALVSAQAIFYELRQLGVTPTPPARTIHSWLKQAGLVEVGRSPTPPGPASKPYPTPKRDAVNDLHQLDLKGPLYLTDSAQKHYVLALRDFRSKRVALMTTPNKQAQTLTDFLVAAWQRLGLPHVLQMDNALELRGSNRYPRSFGKVVRVCLDLGIEPLFVPPREPWRNGFIENFNGQLDRLLLHRERFASPDDLQAGVRKLETAVNTTHRLEALDGQTPAEFVADEPLRLLRADYDPHQRDLQLLKGTIACIRLVRKSGRITLFANDKFDIDPELKWQYVLARIDVAARQLHVFHEGVLIKTFDYLMRSQGV
jgi:transposase InsO family protein